MRSISLIDSEFRFVVLLQLEMAIMSVILFLGVANLSGSFTEREV